ncbi:MAG: endonuclease/exonuclease/phosphatase family protein [Bdellovibrionales bacterium]|jgi:endonuclease/exonuclease/phosphatase family metal-dependent hydrolase|nr:endonuclease/exonuclease/phosphatase family protein [Bdellovibrionales bacterium]MBT3526264.1 endonuclease/exonuclease/phosphatase family protein [Bdellovibrionales bacterium]MBT7766700.1 endonuclease/exonuclease/phosphatase family protein [Bdellovibrionales bacterium]
MKLRVISSNIRFANQSDGAHDWPVRKPILANIINQFAPDLLGTQEGKQLQIQELAASLSPLILVDQHRKWITERMYPSIFINPATVELLDSGDIWLSSTPAVAGSISFNSAFPRLCTWVKARLIPINQNILYINVHLDHHYEDTRIEQIRVLLEETQKINRELNPIILSGDFNDPPHKKVWQTVTGKNSKLLDPWHYLNNPEESSHHQFKGVNPNGSRIDWIMVDPIFNPISIELDKSCSTKGIYPSDHFPLKAIFGPLTN